MKNEQKKGDWPGFPLHFSLLMFIFGSFVYGVEESKEPMYHRGNEVRTEMSLARDAASCHVTAV